MSGKSSFPYRKYDRKPHPHIVKQILEDNDLIEMMKEVLIQEKNLVLFVIEGSLENIRRIKITGKKINVKI
jgi:hypothetical protein